VIINITSGVFDTYSLYYDRVYHDRDFEADVNYLDNFLRRCSDNRTTAKGRPLHVVCAYSAEDDLVIVITSYQPDPRKWVDYERSERDLNN
jgi:hypothetical protein